MQIQSRFFQCLTGAAMLLMTVHTASGATTIDFESLSTPSGQDYYNGSDGAGEFSSQGVTFNNEYNASFGSWDGFAYSQTTDTTTSGFTNQYSAYTGGGVNSSATYAVGNTGFNNADVTLPVATKVRGAYITNTTYAALSMLNGDQFAKKFGDDPATENVVESDYPDWFTLTVTGFDDEGNQTGVVTFDLADYTAPGGQNELVDTWRWVNLSPLGNNVTSLSFNLSSSDVGDFGMNTPAYFAMDDFTVDSLPEPTSAALLLGLSGLVFGRRRRRS